MRQKKEQGIDLPSVPEAVQKADGKDEMKNQNPNNQNHNIKKEALGPNTKR